MDDVTQGHDAADLAARVRQAKAAHRQAYDQFRRRSSAVYRAMEGWRGVTSEEEWLKICQDSRAEYESGRFLLERLGAERFLDPKLAATLWQRRQRLLEEREPATAAEALLADLTVCAYSNALRAQGWLGDLALRIEFDLFALNSPTRKNGYPTGGEWVVEDWIQRLADKVLPIIDRANRLVIRNLKAMQELRQGVTPAVAIGRAEQVNVSTKQANAFLPGDRHARGAAARNGRPRGPSANGNGPPGRPRARRGGSRKHRKGADEVLLGAGNCQEVEEHQPE
jgi:hypothetical protein